MLSRLLSRASCLVGRRHGTVLMKQMGLHALHRKPHSSKWHLAHKVYSYLLRNLMIVRLSQDWAADITYIPRKRRVVYLFAEMDWASRRVLVWRLSNTLTTEFCMEAV